MVTCKKKKKNAFDRFSLFEFLTKKIVWNIVFLSLRKFIQNGVYFFEEETSVVFVLFESF